MERMEQNVSHEDEVNPLNSQHSRGKVVNCPEPPLDTGVQELAAELKGALEQVKVEFLGRVFVDFLFKVINLRRCKHLSDFLHCLIHRLSGEAVEGSQRRNLRGVNP